MLFYRQIERERGVLQWKTILTLLFIYQLSYKYLSCSSSSHAAQYYEPGFYCETFLSVPATLIRHLIGTWGVSALTGWRESWWWVDYLLPVFSLINWIRTNEFFQTLVGVPGILGNIISIIVLTSKDMKNSFNLLLSCLAVIDILFNILAVSDYAFFRGM